MNMIEPKEAVSCITKEFHSVGFKFHYKNPRPTWPGYISFLAVVRLFSISLNFGDKYCSITVITTHCALFSQ